MIIVGLHSIHGIDSNTPEGAGAHPKEGGLRPTRHGGGGVGQLNSMSLTPARSTPVQVLLNDSQVSDGTPPDGTEGGDQEDELVVYEVGIEVEPAEKFDLSDFVEDGNVRKIHNGGEGNVIIYDLERTEKGCYRAKITDMSEFSTYVFFVDNLEKVQEELLEKQTVIALSNDQVNIKNKVVLVVNDYILLEEGPSFLFIVNMWILWIYSLLISLTRYIDI